VNPNDTYDIDWLEENTKTSNHPSRQIRRMHKLTEGDAVLVWSEREERWCRGMVKEFIKPCDDKECWYCKDKEPLERVLVQYVNCPAGVEREGKHCFQKELNLKAVKCTECKWQGSGAEVHSIIECGEDTCPKCGEHHTLKEVPHLARNPHLALGYCKKCNEQLKKFGTSCKEGKHDWIPNAHVMEHPFQTTFRVVD